MDLLELAKKVKFKLEYIYIVGFDSFGHRIKACVCYIPTGTGNGNVSNRYAYVKSGDKMLFLQETYFDNKFEFTYSVPLVMWFGFKEQYIKKLEDLEEVLAESVLGKKVEELRKQYTYNPFLDNNDSKPWYYTLKDLDDEYEKTGKQFMENELLPEDRPVLEQVFANKKKAIGFKASMTMTKRYEKAHDDPMLIIEAVDRMHKKVHL